MKFIKLFIFCVILYGCSDEYREFVIPIVNGNIEKDSVLFIEGERADDFPLFAGLYDSGIDSIQVNWQTKRDSRMPYYDRDTNWSYDFDIKVDYSQDVYIQKRQRYITFPVFIINPSSTDSLSISNLIRSSSFNLHIADSLNVNWTGIESYSSFGWYHIRWGTLRIPPNSFIILLYPKENKGEVVPMKIIYDFWNGRSMESPVFEGAFPKSNYNVFIRSNGKKGLQHQRFDDYYKH